MASQSAGESPWPHLLGGFALSAGLVAYAGADPTTAGVAGLVGAVLGYILHNWQRPQVRCWWPAWWWLPPGLKGCKTRATTGGKFYAFKAPCPLHPQTSYYIRPVARMFGWGGPKERKDR